ncbi:MAG: hypothetical protein OEV15_08325 [Gallionella sp.]|nr:hypothetical protein [Gallionella sp.]
MKYILIAITLFFAACDKPATPKIAESQREVLDKAKDLDQMMQENTEAMKQQVQDATE